MALALHGYGVSRSITTLPGLAGTVCRQDDAHLPPERKPPDERHALEQLVGTLQLREILAKGANLEAWIASWDLSEFERARADVLMYR